jgi:hypothetical protein
MTLMTEDVAQALLDMRDVVSSMEDGIGALIVVGNAMMAEEKTAEFKALVFVTDKLGQDVQKIYDLPESVRYRRPPEGVAA